MDYIAIKPVGKFAKGAIVTEKDFTEARIGELLKMGVLSPADGLVDVPSDEGGLRGVVDRLTAENSKLRTAKGGPEQLAKIMELEATVAAQEARIKGLQSDKIRLSEAVVPLGQHKQLQAQFDQLTRLHETTMAEMDKLTAPAGKR